MYNDSFNCYTLKINTCLCALEEAPQINPEKQVLREGIDACESLIKHSKDKTELELARSLLKRLVKASLPDICGVLTKEVDEGHCDQTVYALRSFYRLDSFARLNTKAGSANTDGINRYRLFNANTPGNLHKPDTSSQCSSFDQSGINSSNQAVHRFHGENPQPRLDVTKHGLNLGTPHC